MGCDAGFRTVILSGRAGYGLATANILYHLPDHPSLLQSFVWQFHDIAPDYPALSANLPAEIAIVQNSFQAFVSVVSLETIADTIREQLRVLRMQLENRTEEAQADVVIANGDVAIAQAEKVNIQKQIDLIQQDIVAAQSQSFSLGGFLTTVGTIAVGLAGMASGPGAIISIAAGIASGLVIFTDTTVVLRRPYQDSKVLNGSSTNPSKD